MEEYGVDIYGIAGRLSQEWKQCFGVWEQKDGRLFRGT